MDSAVGAVSNRDVEQLTEEIVRRVIALLRQGESQPPTHEGECLTCDGQCVEICPTRTHLAIEAGASRISATLGATAVDGSIANLIDHTLLRPDATPEQIAQLCYEARQYGFAAVCINPSYVRLAAQILRGSPVAVCSVVGFPLGATPPEVKAYEALQAIRNGASEVDMVLNIGALKAGDYNLVERDIATVVKTCHDNAVLCKVIIEAALLTEEEKIKACTLAKAAGADYVKTSTGFGPGGATVEDVALMRRVVGPGMGIKAAGGIRSFADAEKMVRAGATRIGASAGVKIVQEAQQKASSE
jgi:deoxyribose-phosphate aldolase